MNGFKVPAHARCGATTGVARTAGGIQKPRNKGGNKKQQKMPLAVRQQTHHHARPQPPQQQPRKVCAPAPRRMEYDIEATAPLLYSLRRIQQADSTDVVSTFANALLALESDEPTPTVDAAIVRCDYYRSPPAFR